MGVSSEGKMFEILLFSEGGGVRITLELYSTTVGRILYIYSSASQSMPINVRVVSSKVW